MTKKDNQAGKTKASNKKFKPMSEDAIKNVARDILEQKIFTSDHISEVDMSLLPMIFMPFCFGGLDQIDIEDTGLIYEHYDKAGPRCVNGYPMFTSCCVMSIADTKRMWAYYNKFEKIRETMMCATLDEKDG